MLIHQLFAQKRPVVSFEIFPPKPDSPLESIFDCIEELQALKPDFISVTYGAAGSTRGRTLEVARHIQHDHGIPALGHLTCVGATAETIQAILHEFAAHGIENILALRGDPPKNAPFPPTPYRAKDLIRLIRQQRRSCSVAAAAYPEGHLESPSREDDLRFLKEKVDTGVDFLITQIFFDNAILYRFLEDARALGIDVPVMAGIMPVFSRPQVERICSLCGATLPPALRKLMEKYGHDKEAMEQAGLEYASRQIADLLAHDIDGVHLYTMNRPHLARTLVRNTSLR
ncbi:5,10-methylenetetrahydrofolate reductase [Thermosinus carboxydivorans Nor1]|uniref:Methylenetetrahydrofolate reductase n=1 Tax=Thermosinus carboxydivorans Nor1 TaxID=401526 RepID=A1HTM2_9FIRM|nr:methylenetetrahydrofolate reductase [NAD(P)H] [Thermosinus carboxydivorans]EAX46633.1 5,10-methylenetetrahydrofolate reductase [Thermosinus carboxydivorans Nor1]